MVPNEDEVIKEVRKLDYPTPFFYTSKKILKHNYEAFVNLLEDVGVYYAIKANSDSKVVSYLSSLGAGFEAASSYEIDELLSLGVEPTSIIYGTSIKPPTHIQHAFKLGIDRFAADSKEEITKIAENAPGSKVLVRAQVYDVGSVFSFSERFGIPIEYLKDLVTFAKKKELKTYGISFHVGSQAVSANRWSNAISEIRPVIEELYNEGVTIEALDLGGGYPVIYYNHQNVPHLHEIVSNIKNALHMLPYMPKVIIEPGRGIVASSTVMVSEIISKTVREGKTWLCMDGGIYNALYEAMIHQGSTQYNVVPFNNNTKGSDAMHATLSGPTGDSLDIIARDISLPKWLGTGDRLIFENAGAYTVTMASPFNGFPKPELYIG